MSCPCPECNNDWGGECLYQKISMQKETLTELGKQIDSELEEYQNNIDSELNSTPYVGDLARGVIFGIAACRHIVEKHFLAATFRSQS